MSANTKTIALQPTGELRICPACGGRNEVDAVFCANPACHKALGEFKYVREELLAGASWHETLAERATQFIGKPHFLVAHVFWMLLWIGVNTGLIAMIRRFDDYPFSLLGLMLTAEAIFITGFLLISQNRQNAHADKRAELDYEVSVRTYREVVKIEALMSSLSQRVERLEAGTAQSVSNAAAEISEPPR